jgi:hypothetical protein
MKTLGLVIISGALTLSVSAASAPVTWVAKGQVTSITNERLVSNDVVGPAVSASSIPFQLGDSVRFLFTYDDAIPASSISTCGNGTANFYTGALMGGAMYSDDFLGAILGGNQSAIQITRGDCGSINGNQNQGLAESRVAIGGHMDAAAIETIPSSNGGAELWFGDPCIPLASNALPSGLLDPANCALDTHSRVTLHWLNVVGHPTTQYNVEVHVGNLTVGLPSCSDLIAQLTGDVFQLNLRHGIRNSLDSKLDAAIRAADEVSGNHDATAANQIDAFINAVSAQKGNAIGHGEADALTNAANTIIACLSQ